MVVLYALTMFLGAALLFIVQPMVAKLLLPTLGGSAAVWTTCMLFFQAMLVAGYAYAHASAKWLGHRRMVILHLGLFCAGAVVLPLSVPTLSFDPSAQPTIWLLSVLAISIGAPFFAVSATAPLLQHFFAQTSHPDASDPYFLYAASNLGSMVALLGYPFLVEPMAGLRAQTVGWAVVYACLGGLLFACGRTVFGVRRALDADASTPVSWRRRARWVWLAAVPSSLMLGVTQHITTDLAPVPLLWVIPLALYLATYVLVFARRPVRLGDRARTVLPIAALVVLGVVNQFGGTLAASLHLLNFFAFALFFHSRLASERPSAAQLTEYFLLVSIGGAVGGLFNAIVAPLIFDQPLEYYVVMFASVATIAVHGAWVTGRARRIVSGLVATAACFYLWATALLSVTQWYAVLVTLLGIAILVRWRPRAQNVVIFGVLTLGAWVQFSDRALLYDRSFFAAYKVYERERDQGVFRYLRHGTTLHGVQAVDPGAAQIPRSYHHPNGPVGEVFEDATFDSVLVVGLGVGAMAAYSRADSQFVFYEIDPLVHEIATDWFTYLSSCEDRCEVRVGDGRRLLSQTDRRFDLIVLDAYNSSGVPTHLLTREAVQLYAERLKPGGLLLFNVSNRYVDVAAVVGTVCADAGLSALERSFDPPWKRAYEELIDASQFIVAAPHASALARFAKHPDRWKPPPTTEVVWTDDYTNLVDVIRW